LEGVELRPGSFNKAANTAEVANACNECVAAWCTLADSIVDEANAVRPVRFGPGYLKKYVEFVPGAATLPALLS
jgi:hypothetical protein